MEKERISVMDSWHLYASLPSFALLTDAFPEFVAGAGKSVLWYVGSRMIL
jgi:hypothetical protein